MRELKIFIYRMNQDDNYDLNNQSSISLSFIKNFRDIFIANLLSIINLKLESRRNGKIIKIDS